MEGKTHVLTGIATATVAYGILNNAPIINLYHVPQTPVMTYAILGAAVVGSLAPDFDIPESTVSGTITMVNMRFIKTILNFVLAAVIGFIVLNSKDMLIFYGGIAAIAFVALGYSKLASKILHYLRLFIQCGLILFLGYMYVRTNEIPYLLISITTFLYVISKHRGISHTPFLNLIGAYVIYYSLNFYQMKAFALPVAAYFFLGSMAHIYLNDFFTNSGVPNPIYPFDVIIKLIILIVKEKRFDLSIIKGSFDGFRIKFPITGRTGGPVEELAGFIMIGVIIVSFKIFN